MTNLSVRILNSILHGGMLRTTVTVVTRKALKRTLHTVPVRTSMPFVEGSLRRGKTFAESWSPVTGHKYFFSSFALDRVSIGMRAACEVGRRSLRRQLGRRGDTLRRGGGELTVFTPHAASALPRIFSYGSWKLEPLLSFRNRARAVWGCGVALRRVHGMNESVAAAQCGGPGWSAED